MFHKQSTGSLDYAREIAFREHDVCTGKTEEEIRKFEVDEYLRPVERAIFLLNSKQEIQRQSAVRTLPSLVRSHSEECLQKVFPKLKEILPSAGADLQQAAATSFLQILKEELVQIQHYTQTFLLSILAGIEHKSEEIANAWLETLLDLIDILPLDVLKHEVLRTALAKAQFNQSVQGKVASCKILGKLTNRLDSNLVKRDILPVVQSLCQDTDAEVRACMCQQLFTIANTIGRAEIKVSVIPELLELSKDDNQGVRCSAALTVVQLVTLVDEETCRDILVPLAVQCYEGCFRHSAQSDYVADLSKHLGPFCHSVAHFVDDSTRNQLILVYNRLAVLHADEERYQMNQQRQYNYSDMINNAFLTIASYAECRQRAAFNFPAMLLFVGVGNFECDLRRAFDSLCADPSPAVRQTILCSFHEVFSQFRSKSEKVDVLLDSLFNLLQDECEEVLRTCAVAVAKVIQLCGGSQDLSVEPLTKIKLPQSDDFISAIIVCEEKISQSFDWRTQVAMLETIALLYLVLPGEALVSRVLPKVRERIRSRPLPVRQAAVRTLFILLRYIRLQKQREECFTRVRQELAYSAKSFDRCLFADCVTRTVLELYSQRFARGYLYEAILALCDDPTVSVRLHAYKALPLMKQLLFFPSNQVQYQEVERCVRRLILSQDSMTPTEACLVSKVVSQHDEIQIRATVSSSIVTKKTISKFDMDDHAKEEHERVYFELDQIKLSDKKSSRRMSDPQRIAAVRAAAAAGSDAAKNLVPRRIPVLSTRRPECNEKQSEKPDGSASKMKNNGAAVGENGPPAGASSPKGKNTPNSQRQTSSARAGGKPVIVPKIGIRRNSLDTTSNGRVQLPALRGQVSPRDGSQAASKATRHK